MLARNQTERLQTEILKLEKWLETQPFHPLFEDVRRIHRKLRIGSRYSAYRYHYLQDAIAVNAVLDNPRDETALNKLIMRASNTIGSAIPERKAMGACLTILGVGLLVISTLLLSTVIACSFPLAGFFVLLGANASIMLGIGLFRAGLQRGMARELDKLAQLSP